MKSHAPMKIMIVIMIFAIISSVGLAKNEITVGYSDNTLRIQTRLLDIAFDTRHGYLRDIIFLMTDQPTHVFAHMDDGFDLFQDGERIPLTDIRINGRSVSSFSDPQVFEGQDLYVELIYPAFQKTITILHGPHYQMELSITGQVPENVRLSLPRTGFAASDQIDDSGKVFVSFYDRTQALAIYRINTPNTLFSSRDRDLANQLDVPYSGLQITAYIGPNKLTLIRHVFPEDYTWLSRVINAYPGGSTWHTPIFYMFVYLLDWLEMITGNYGWAIILFTIIIYLALYPLIHAQNKSMIKQRMLQMDEEFKKVQLIKDPREKQQKLMKLYKEKKVNPGGGCLMMLIPLPIFFLLFAVIRYESEVFAFSNPFLFWQDLSIGGFAQNFGIVLVSVFISVFNSLITAPEIRVARQGLLFAFFPFLFITLSTGLQLYWVTSSLIRLATTYWAYRKHNLKGIPLKEFLASFKRKS